VSKLCWGEGGSVKKKALPQRVDSNSLGGKGNSFKKNGKRGSKRKERVPGHGMGGHFLAYKDQGRKLHQLQIRKPPALGSLSENMRQSKKNDNHQEGKRKKNQGGGGGDKGGHFSYYLKVRTGRCQNKGGVNKIKG